MKTSKHNKEIPKIRLLPNLDTPSKEDVFLILYSKRIRIKASSWAIVEGKNTLIMKLFYRLKYFLARFEKHESMILHT